MHAWETDADMLKPGGVRMHQWGVQKVCWVIKTGMQGVHGPTEIWLGSLWGISYAIKHREMGCAWRGMCQGETRMVQVHQAGLSTHW